MITIGVGRITWKTTTPTRIATTDEGGVETTKTRIQMEHDHSSRGTLTPHYKTNQVRTYMTEVISEQMSKLGETGTTSMCAGITYTPPQQLHLTTCLNHSGYAPQASQAPPWHFLPKEDP